MSALLTWLAGIVASADGTTPSATRICGVMLVLAFIANMFWLTNTGGMALCAALVCACFGLRDGSPVTEWIHGVNPNASGGPPPGGAP